MTGPDGDDRLVLSNVASHITYDEIHSAALGSMGLLFGLAAGNGFPRVALLVSIALLTVMFGLNSAVIRFFYWFVKNTITSGPRTTESIRTKSKASKVIAAEPWYFAVSYVLSFTLTASLSSIVPS